MVEKGKKREGHAENNVENNVNGEWDRSAGDRATSKSPR